MLGNYLEWRPWFSLCRGFSFPQFLVCVRSSSVTVTHEGFIKITRRRKRFLSLNCVAVRVCVTKKRWWGTLFYVALPFSNGISTIVSDMITNKKQFLTDTVNTAEIGHLELGITRQRRNWARVARFPFGFLSGRAISRIRHFIFCWSSLISQRIQIPSIICLLP